MAHVPVPPQPWLPQPSQSQTVGGRDLSCPLSSFWNHCRVLGWRRRRGRWARSAVEGMGWSASAGLSTTKHQQGNFFQGCNGCTRKRHPPPHQRFLQLLRNPNTLNVRAIVRRVLGVGGGSRVSARSLHAKFTVRYVSGWGGGTTVAVEKQGNMGPLKRRACHVKGV